MNVKVITIVAAMIIMSGCSNDYADMEKSLKTIEQEKIELSEIIEEQRIENEKLVEQLKISNLKLVDIEDNHWKELHKANTKNAELNKELDSISQELNNIRSWSRLPQNASSNDNLIEYNVSRFISETITEDTTPIHGVIICDMYISQVETLDDRSLLVFKLHELLENWEEKYNKIITDIINETVEGHSRERMYADWFTKGMIESDINEINSLENKELSNILIDAKFAGYVASRDEEFVSLEHDTSFLIEKYRDHISEDLLVYLELEELMKRYGSWHSEEASNMQLELISIIKKKYSDSKFNLMSLEELNTYEDELKYQLENMQHWDTYGSIDSRIELHT